jgi:hypothetical protein
LAVFDGDHATTTVALGDHDPLQACVAAMMANSVNDRWLMRRLSGLVRQAGFDLIAFHSHGFSETAGGAYMLTVIDRGADILHTSGVIGQETAAALKVEARRRVQAGTFFGHIAYASLTARKPPRESSRLTRIHRRLRIADPTPHRLAACIGGDHGSSQLRDEPGKLPGDVRAVARRSSVPAVGGNDPRRDRAIAR